MTNSRVLWVWVTSVLLAFVSCSGDSPRTASEHADSVNQALSVAQERVLQFEAPTTDWTTTSGSVSASTAIAQGSAALAVNRPSSSWTEVCSTQLSSLGSVGNTLALQLLQQSTPSWGTIQLFVRIPSLGHWNAAIQPPITLHDKAPNVFRSLTFPLPDPISQALSGTYADLRLCFIINAAAGVYVLDDLRFSGLTTATASTSGTTGSGGVGGSVGGAGGSIGGTGAAGPTSGGVSGAGATTSDGGSGATSATTTTGVGPEGGTGGTDGDGGTAGEVGDPSECVPRTEDWDQLIVQLPRGLTLDDVALGSQGGELDIHDGVAVRTGDGQGFANIAALEGAGDTQLGAYAESGNIFSGPPHPLAIQCEGPRLCQIRRCDYPAIGGSGRASSDRGFRPSTIRRSRHPLSVS